MMDNRFIPHYSMWELAHRWNKIEKLARTPEETPFEVIDTLRKLALAIYNHDLAVRLDDGTLHSACITLSNSPGDIPKNEHVNFYYREKINPVDSPYPEQEEAVTKIYPLLMDSIVNIEELKSIHIQQWSLEIFLNRKGTEYQLSPPSFWFDSSSTTLLAEHSTPLLQILLETFDAEFKGRGNKVLSKEALTPYLQEKYPQLSDKEAAAIDIILRPAKKRKRPETIEEYMQPKD